MWLQTHRDRPSGFTSCTASLRHCPYCGDRLVAPVTSEFVDGMEIRHHWECEACGRTAHISLELRH